MTTTSKALGTSLMEALDVLEIKHYMKVQGLTQTTRKVAYNVEVSGGINVRKWFSVIGSNNPKHITKHQVWDQFGFCPPYTKVAQRKKYLSRELNPNLFYNARVPETLDSI